MGAIPAMQVCTRNHNTIVENGFFPRGFGILPGLVATWASSLIVMWFTYRTVLAVYWLAGYLPISAVVGAPLSPYD